MTDDPINDQFHDDIYGDKVAYIDSRYVSNDVFATQFEFIPCAEPISVLALSNTLIILPIALLTSTILVWHSSFSY